LHLTTMDTNLIKHLVSWQSKINSFIIKPSRGFSLGGFFKPIT
jgi:hypothetical protein